METYPFPREGVREAIYNALAHNNYAASVPIQICIEDGAMYISNSCILPRDWTVETLMQTHRSVPYNPSIANAFYRAGYIEAWGRGIQKIIEACRELGAPDPEYTVLGDDLTVKFTALKNAQEKALNPPIRHIGGLDGGLAEKILKNIIEKPTITQSELAEELNVPLRTLQRAIKEMKNAGILVRVGGNRFGHWEVHR